MDKDSSNSNDARDNYREALRLLDAMKKDPGAEKLLQRADFKAIYDAATAGAQAGKARSTLKAAKPTWGQPPPAVRPSPQARRVRCYYRASCAAPCMGGSAAPHSRRKNPPERRRQHATGNIRPA